MFKESNRIIIVDNDQADLDKISHEFNLKGIGCRTFLYDGINIPDEPLSNIRIAFFDINLMSSSSDQAKYATLESAIQSYISVNNGPYVLIFWTNNASWKDEFIKFVNRDPNKDNIVRDKLKPYFISTIDKTSISEQNSLESMLTQQLNNTMVELCLSFDNQLAEASDKAISTLLSMVSTEDKWGETKLFEEELKKLFTKIATSSWGLSNAKNNPDGAINDAILPVISHSLPRTNLWKSFLSSYMDNISKEKDILTNNNASSLLLMKLNNFFLIDETASDPISRGIVIKLKPDLFKDYFNIDFDTWKKQEFGDGEDLNTAFPIAVEISAACDYCQQKPRNNRYLMGIACNKKIKNKNNLKNIYITDAFLLKDQPLYTAFDFNYVFIDTKQNILDTTIFGFKKEMMDMIINQYANHISRIGITSFKQ